MRLPNDFFRIHMRHENSSHRGADAHRRGALVNFSSRIKAGVRTLSSDAFQGLDAWLGG